MSLPVCERFRPFRVSGDLSKSSSAGTSDDDCMEAELGPVREKQQHRTLTPAECFPLISQCCFSGRQRAENEIELEADTVSFSPRFLPSLEATHDLAVLRPPSHRGENRQRNVND